MTEAAPCEAATLAWLRTPEAIRARAEELFARALAGRSDVFELDMARLDAAADFVAATVRQNYPDLNVPHHARWRHFAAGGVDRWAAMAHALRGVPPDEVARIRVDLVVLSVLLDAGAGPDWRYTEPRTSLVFGRSEGLAVASLHAFQSGLFSADPHEPLRADAAALERVDAAALARAFQACEDNPLAGLPGRAALLRNLGAALRQRPDMFRPITATTSRRHHLSRRAGEVAAPGLDPGAAGDAPIFETTVRPAPLTPPSPPAKRRVERGRSGHHLSRDAGEVAAPGLDPGAAGEGQAGGGRLRIGHLFDHLRAQATQDGLPARAILSAILAGFGSIWPGGASFAGEPLGDVWRHEAVAPHGPAPGLVPFHKLSQWLAYSLIEVMEAAGTAVRGIGALTGLPEYRNGGLFIDFGVLRLRDPRLGVSVLHVKHPAVVEWRALTVALLDRIAPLVRARLGRTEAEMPLSRVLEGGTWAAGRRIARERRPDGGPPLRVETDGTVF